MNRKPLPPLVLIALLTLSTPLLADLNSAKRLISIGSGEQAVMELTRLAGEGHSEAQYLLGKLYAEGTLTPQDHSRATLALTLSIENGYAHGQSLLESEKKKINLMQLAALQEEIGAFFQNGGPVKANHERAAQWLGERALNPIPYTHEERGEMARKVGKIHEEKGFSFTAAHTWYTLAEAFGSERAQKDRKRMELFLQEQSLSQSRNSAIKQYKRYLKHRKKMVEGKL